MERRRGWFKLDDQDGDRTLQDQLKGLESIQWSGKTVLDLGCAEGLIAKHAALCGAAGVTGVEIVPGHVEVAKRLCDCLPCAFECADLNAWSTDEKFDIVLMLAILHKLRDPTAALAGFIASARELVVMRLPPKKAPWMIVDSRSGNQPHNMMAAMTGHGWKLVDEKRGHFDEWVGMWRPA